jgi:hypothetical protein
VVLLDDVDPSASGTPAAFHVVAVSSESGSGGTIYAGHCLVPEGGV